MKTIEGERLVTNPDGEHVASDSRQKGSGDAREGGRGENNSSAVFFSQKMCLLMF